jgi:FkbM family methyltransferase
VLDPKKLRTAPIWARVASSVIPHLPRGRYRLARWLALRAPAPFWGRMPAKLGGAWFCCNPLHGGSRDVYFTGWYEPQETALLLELLRPGMTFVDVGANWGYFTLLAASRLGPRGQVIALEPDPRLFQLLQANVDRNRFTEVVVRQVAAADRCGQAAFAQYDETSENWGLSHLTEDPCNGTCMVATCPLDDLLDEVGVDCIDLLKMDIEGAEELALRGMAAGLARHRYKRLLLEVHPQMLKQRGRTVADVFTLLRQANYRGWEIDHAPRTTWRMSYAKKINVRDLLRPALKETCAEQWPHLLWTAPGVDDMK